MSRGPSRPDAMTESRAETGPLATAWHSNKFLDPVTDGAVLPILHLNGYKISNPTLLARIPREELEQLLRGYGWTPYFVEGYVPDLMHEAMATTLDKVVQQIHKIQKDVQRNINTQFPRFHHQALEVLQRAELRMNRFVTALSRANRPRAAHISITCHQRVIRAFAVAQADRVNRG